MSDSEEEVFLMLRQSSFGNSFGPSTATDFCVSRPTSHIANQGPVVRSLVSANHWLRGIKMYRFLWYLTLVSTNYASSNPSLDVSR